MAESEEAKIQTALVPIEERAVDFYGDQVLAVLVEETGQRRVYIPLRPIAEYLGLDWAGQYQRIKRDAVLSEVVRLVGVTPTNRGGNPNVAAIPLDYLNGWLFGVNAARIKPELRDRVIRYQRECYQVLARAFQPEASAAAGELATLQQVAAMGRAITALAEQQIAYQLQTTTRLDRAAEVVRGLDRRLTTVERKLAAGPVTEEQAAEISARVKALAEYLSSKEPGTAGAGQRQVHYQAIFGELYRQFGVTSYKAIPLDRFDEVMRFLEDWRRAAGE